MTAKSRKPNPQPLADSQLENVQGGLIGLLKPAALTTAETTQSGIVKTGAGTLTLNNSNTY